MGFTCLLLIPGSEIAPLCEELLSYMSAKVCLKNYWENEENLKKNNEANLGTEYIHQIWNFH